MADPTHLTPTFVSNYTGALAAFLGHVTTAAIGFWGAGSVYAVPTYYSGGVLRPSPFLQTIVGSSIEVMLATQRRRVGR